MKPLAVIVSVIALSAECGIAATLVAPAQTDGGRADARGGPFVDSDERFQQVFAASDFLAAGPTLRITDLSFAKAFGSYPIDVTIPDIAIHLSTTLRKPHALSTTFSENIGADDLVVFSGPLHFFENGSGTYNIHVPLQTGFAYTPGTGNLLLDVFQYQGVPPPPQSVYALTSWSGTFNASAAEGFIGSPTGGTSGNALIAQFTYTPVPEPSTISIVAIAGIAATALQFIRTRQKQAAQPRHPEQGC